MGGGPRVVVSTAAFHARVRGSVPGLGGLKETKLFLPHPRVKVSIMGSLRDREVACSASDRQGSNFESCVWRTVSSQSSHHPQEVLLAQFSLYVHKGGLKPDSFHFVARLVVIWCLIGYIWSRCTISGCRVIFTSMWETNFISLQAHYSALFSFWLISLACPLVLNMCYEIFRVAQRLCLSESRPAQIMRDCGNARMSGSMKNSIYYMSQ